MIVGCAVKLDLTRCYLRDRQKNCNQARCEFAVGWAKVAFVCRVRLQ